MLCIVSFVDNKPTGWIIATDVDDARRQAQAAGRLDIAQAMYAAPPQIPRGSHLIAADTWVLVD
jgi:hypothetical protein